MPDAQIHKPPAGLSGLESARLSAALPSRLAELDLPPEAWLRVQELMAGGIRLDEYGLVIPTAGRATLHKIAADLSEVRQRIGQALADGLHVLYTPGSYDLVHVGHAAYIQECTQHYLAQNRELKRENVYVVALADDDVLVEGVKPVHLLAAERWDREHDERHPRPIQRTDYFGHITPVHPRLLDLASLPVDLVGVIPNPIAFGGTVFASGQFKEWLRRGRELPEPDAAARASVRQAVEKYGRLLRLLSSGEYGQVVESFNRARLNLGYDPDQAVWDVRSWQLLMHRFLGDVPARDSSERYVRLLSERDEKYKHEAAEIMALCGINHRFVADLHLVSTTQLLEHFSWKTLLESKQRSLAALTDELPDPAWRRG